MERRLADHLNSPDFKPNGQLVAVAVRPAPDGDGVFVVLKIERCVDILPDGGLPMSVTEFSRALMTGRPV